MNSILLIDLGRQYGGVEKVVEKLALKTNDDFFRVYILSINGSYLNKRCSMLTSEVLTLPSNKILCFMYIFKTFYYIKKYNINLIHCHGVFSSLIGTICGIITNTKVITTVHGIVDYERKGIKKYIYKFIEDSLIIYNKKYICVSNFLKDELIKRKVNVNKITVIYNSIELTHNENKNKKVKKYYLKQDFKICSVGRLEDIKGHIYLIKAIEILKNKGYNVQCIIAGRGNLYNKLQDYIKKNCLQDVVELIGFINDPSDLILQSDLIVNSSLMETFGISVAEAMILKKCVISTNVGGIPELIENGVNGILVKEANEDALANEIQRCYRDRSIIKRIEDNLQTLDLSKFYDLHMINNYNKLYDKIINNDDKL